MYLSSSMSGLSCYTGRGPKRWRLEAASAVSYLHTSIDDLHLHARLDTFVVTIDSASYLNLTSRLSGRSTKGWYQNLWRISQFPSTAESCSFSTIDIAMLMARVTIIFSRPFAKQGVLCSLS